MASATACAISWCPRMRRCTASTNRSSPTRRVPLACANARSMSTRIAPSRAGHLSQDVVQRRRCALREAVEIARQAEPRVRRVEPPERPLAGRHLELQRREGVVDARGRATTPRAPRRSRAAPSASPSCTASRQAAFCSGQEPGPVRRDARAATRRSSATASAASCARRRARIRRTICSRRARNRAALSARSLRRRVDATPGVGGVDVCPSGGRSAGRAGGWRRAPGRIRERSA